MKHVTVFRFLAAAEKVARAFVVKEKKPRQPTPVAKYIKENYELGKRRYPDLTSTALLGRLASDYKNLSESEKAKFKSP